MTAGKFELAALVEMDGGRIREAFEQAVARCESDCHDRPAVESARKVNLTVSLTPVPDPDGEFTSCDVQFQVSDTVPKRKSRVYNMRTTRGGLVFNDLSPDDAAQMTIDQVGPKENVNAG